MCKLGAMPSGGFSRPDHGDVQRRKQFKVGVTGMLGQRCNQRCVFVAEEVPILKQLADAFAQRSLWPSRREDFDLDEEFLVVAVEDEVTGVNVGVWLEAPIGCPLPESCNQSLVGPAAYLLRGFYVCAVVGVALGLELALALRGLEVRSRGGICALPAPRTSASLSCTMSA